MNKTKLLIATGTFALALGSFFAGNATKKLFTSITNLYYTSGALHTCTQISSTAVFTTGGAGANITFRTNAGPVTVFSNNTCTTVVNVKLKA